MGSDATVLVHGADGAELAAHALRRLHDLDQRWSRFRDDSEIARLNHAGGAPTAVSADTVRLVTALVQAWWATHGAFDPTLLSAVVGLGYRCSVDDLERHTSLRAGTGHRGDPAGVLVDPAAGVVVIPAGTALDPGGLGKGLAADVVLEELLARGAVGAAVEVGGDVAVGGVPHDAPHWSVAVTLPPGPPMGDAARTGPTVPLARGGVATSGTWRRRWSSAAGQVHHLIDPRTGRNPRTDVVGCSVAAGTAAWAEAFTKPAFVLGLDAAISMYDAVGVAALVTCADGTSTGSRAWHELVPDPIHEAAR